MMMAVSQLIKSMKLMDDKGTTLVEMCVAICLLAMMATVTPIVVLSNQAEQELEQFVQQFQADALFAKNYAQLQNKRIYLRIFPSENEYRIYERSSEPLIVATFPKHVCIPGQVSLFAHYTPTGTISQGHTLYFALTSACSREAQTTKQLVMTPGNSVYHYVP